MRWGRWLPALAIPTWLLGLIWQAPPAFASQPKTATSIVLFRPVVCAVPAFNLTLPPPATTTISASSCSPATVLSPSNMLIQPSAGVVAGFTSVTIPKETGLVGTPSTKPAKDASSKYVLLPALPTATSVPPRYVLGPAEMSSASIAEATAYKNRVGQWVVDYTMTSSGARLWDKVAEENFHRMLGVDLNGVVVTAPIIQPTQASFSSFNGKGELAGGFSKAVALALARAMNSKAPGA